MKSLHPFSLSAWLLAGALFSIAPVASAAQRVPSERSKAAPATVAPNWRAASFPAAQVSRLQYREVPVAGIFKVQQYNRHLQRKPAQVGIGRIAARDGVAASLPALRWVTLADGGSVARAEIGSPVALGLRVGLKVDALDLRAQLRFAGSDSPSLVVSAMTGAEMRKLADARGLFWTPPTDGEKQIIEIYLPAGIPRSSVKLQAPQLTHLLINSRNDFKIAEKIGESDACNVDTACRVAELGANFVSAKNAVAHMLFQLTKSDGTSAGYICTGTLLADTVDTSQIPYFYSANHCFAGGEDGIPAQDKQTVANTLVTYWKYEATACGSGVQAAKIPLGGGATLLYSDPDTTTVSGTDAMLLRLNGTPPSGSEFAGWDASLLASNANILGIHHPSGDAKKVSSGQQVTRDSYLTAVAWLSGTTEGGSSGSGLFTADASGYHLRGGLYGGSASCANSGSTTNTQNRDYYSRFDAVFPHIQQWLAPAPTRIRVNGSQPRVPGRPGATVPAAAAPATARLPVGEDSPGVRVRTRIYEP